MSLKPIVGEIKSQVLNDNFSYINQKAEDAGFDPRVDDLIARIGNNQDLDTTEKSQIILAINEIYQDLLSHKADKANPHGVTKSQVGLGSVPNININHFGFGGVDAAPSPSNDLNDIVNTGFYRADSSDFNQPSGSLNWLVLHIRRTENIAVQIALSRANSLMAFRYKTGSSWESWQHVYHTANTIVDSNGFIKVV